MEKQMTNFTRIASLGLVALMAGTSLTSALERTVKAAGLITDPILVDVFEPPVEVDIFEPPIHVDPHVEDDHDIHDVFDNGPITDDHDISDIFDVDGDDEDEQDVASQELLLACKIVGGDLVITNKGDPIPPGTKVRWTALGQHGSVMLPFGLRSGQKAEIELGLSADTGKCTSDVVL
jgi:hypothetical protein